MAAYTLLQTQHDSHVYCPYPELFCDVQSYADALLYQTDASTGSEASTGMPATSNAPQMSEMQPGLAQQPDAAAPMHASQSAAAGHTLMPAAAAQQSEASNR